MLNEVKPNLDLLMSIRLGLAEQYGIPLDVPFRDYKAWYRWTGMEVPAQTMRADFVNQLYSKEGKPCRFEDIFEFERLSKAWLFDEDGLQEWDVDEPRFKGVKGIYVEESSTNLYTITSTSDNLVGNDGTTITELRTPDPIFGDLLPLVRYSKSNRVYNSYYQYRLGVQAPERPMTDSVFMFDVENSSKVGFATSGSAEMYTRISMDGKISTTLDNGKVEVSKLHNGLYFSKTVDFLEAQSLMFSTIAVKEVRDSPASFKVALMQREQGGPTSFIRSLNSPTTRAKEVFNVTIPQGHTITGDWDDTLHLFERDGQLDFEGYGYIRTLEIVPIEVKV